MDTAQILLTVVIVVLSILFIALGIQVFFILREFQKSIKMANKILDNAESIMENVSKPLSNFSTLASGLKIGATIASLLRGKKNKDKDE